MYKILFTSQASRYFKKLKNRQLKKTYETALLIIKENPYKGTAKRGDLAGVYGYDVKYQGTNFEIAYKISEIGGNKVIILLAGTRENFYEQLKRYLKSEPIVR